MKSEQQSATRRWMHTLAIGAVVVIALAGCASDTAGVGSGGGVVATPAEEGALPATISHVFGETTVAEAPERIVTIGWATQDVVAAFGTVPVLTPDVWGGDEDGFSPWFRAEVEELGGELPEILAYNDAGELDFEQILALEPDLILAPYSGIVETEYNRLSEIAPTVAYPERSWAAESWQSLVEVVGDALGQPEKADTIIAESEQIMTAAAEANPRFADRSVVYGVSLTDGATEAGIYIPSDLRVRFLLDLGLQNTPGLDHVMAGVDGENWYGSVSLEELDEVPADLYVAWTTSPEETAYMLNHPTFKLWEPIADGHFLILEDAALENAVQAPTPLSIPYAVEGMVPLINAALDGESVPARN